MDFAALMPTPNWPGFSGEGPLFWILVVTVGVMLYLRATHRVTERQLKLEAENARRQEQTYQAMVQHYRQVAMEQQTRPEAASARSGPGQEVTYLLVENSLQRVARVEARLDALAKELEELKKQLAECDGTTNTLFSSVSDLHHKLNNLNHAVGSLVERV
jgi:DNA repair exonuclease SbcCD ATPase subunit